MLFRSKEMLKTELDAHEDSLLKLDSLLPMMNLEHAALSLGDSFISGTGLEGGDQEEVIGTIVSNLSAMQALNLLRSPKKVFSRFKALFESVNEYSGLLKEKDAVSFHRAFNELLDEDRSGQPILLPVGWHNSEGGHAMYLEIIKDEKTISLHILHKQHCRLMILKIL